MVVNNVINFSRFDGETFETVASSKFNHDKTGLADYLGSPLTTGSFEDFDVRTEVYDFENNQWNDAPDYPYAPGYYINL